MRLPFFSSSPSHDTPSKDRKKKKKTKTNKSNGMEVEAATISSSPATVLSMESAGWPSSSSSAASTPSSSSASPSSSAAQEHGSVSSNAPPAALPSPSTSRPTRQTSTGVTKEDIAVVLRRLDVTVHAITPASDLDAAGAVTQEELAVLLDEMPGEDELLDTFRVFDSNGDGKITAEELRGALEMLGDDGCSVDDCRRMIGEIDSVGDGCVCFPDFARMMLTAVDVQ